MRITNTYVLHDYTPFGYIRQSLILNIIHKPALHHQPSMEVRTYIHTLKMLVEAENDVYYTIRYLVFSVNFRGLFHQVQKFSNKVYIPLVCSMVQASGRQGRAYNMNVRRCTFRSYALEIMPQTTL